MSCSVIEECVEEVQDGTKEGVMNLPAGAGGEVTCFAKNEQRIAKWASGGEAQVEGGASV